MLRKANGLRNKMQNLLIPLLSDRPNIEAVKKLNKDSEKINVARNDIVHSGFFTTRPKATTTIRQCKEFINALVGLYEQNFEIGEAELTASDMSLESKVEAKSKKPSEHKERKG